MAACYDNGVTEPRAFYSPDFAIYLFFGGVGGVCVHWVVRSATHYDSASN